MVQYLLHRYNRWILAFVLWTVGGWSSGCQQQGGGESRAAIARFGNQYLYLEEVQHFMPDTLKGDDSVVFVSKYLEGWVEQQAISEAAGKAIENLDEEIQFEMNQYRQVLVDRALASWLISRNPAKLRVSESDIQNYYRKFPEKFYSQQHYYQFFYVKTDLPNQFNIVSQLQSQRADDLRELIKWAADNAVSYKLDSTYLTEGSLTPLEEGFYFGNIRRSSKETVYPYQHTEDEKTYYDFFRLLDVIKPGEVLPLKMVRDQIRTIIQNQRKQALIEQNVGRLVQQAKDDQDKVEIFE